MKQNIYPYLAFYGRVLRYFYTVCTATQKKIIYILTDISFISYPFDGDRLLGVEAVVPAAVGQVKILHRVVLVPLEAGPKGVGRGPAQSNQ